MIGTNKAGRLSGEAWVTFPTVRCRKRCTAAMITPVQYDEAARAYLERNHSHLGHRYIELFLQSAEPSQ